MERLTVPTSQLLDLLLSDEAIEYARKGVEIEIPELECSPAVSSADACVDEVDGQYCASASGEFWKNPSFGEVESDAAKSPPTNSPVTSLQLNRPNTRNEMADSDAGGLQQASSLANKGNEKCYEVIAASVKRAVAKLENEYSQPVPKGGFISLFCDAIAKKSERIFTKTMDQLKSSWKPENLLVFVTHISLHLMMEVSGSIARENLRLMTKSYAEEKIGSNYSMPEQ
eukprot:m.19590 g.19590  ORF g.19590 m.19590 type:complete len:228 (+) comp27859_c0_seq2:1281-1964(+)